ncbi:MAG: efflux RND transporter periplasmic adaptor subunit [FCB group bacterium]|nr:efflux RND transporter periplasmic adaptor subunit [FCB group bacterium]
MIRKYNLSIIILGLLLSGCADNDKATEKDISKTSVETLKVGTENTQMFLEFSGLLEPNSTVEIFPEVAGKIEEILIDEGTWVKKDEPLAKIDDTDYLLMLEQASAALDLADAGLSNAQSNLNRQTKLKSDGFSSDSILEGVQTAYDVAKAQYDQAKVAFELAMRQLDRTVIKSPVDGYISARGISVGQMAANGMMAFIINDLKNLEITLAASESQVLEIKKDARVQIATPNYPGIFFKGMVTFISRTAGPGGSYKVSIKVPNKSQELYAGWHVSLKIFNTLSENHIVIPGKALLKKSGRWIAMTAKDGIAVEHEIGLANQISDRVIVNSGLNKGDMLIVSGQQYCKAGQPVEILKEWPDLNSLLIN